MEMAEQREKELKDETVEIMQLKEQTEKRAKTSTLVSRASTDIHSVLEEEERKKKILKKFMAKIFSNMKKDKSFRFKMFYEQQETKKTSLSHSKVNN